MKRFLHYLKYLWRVKWYFVIAILSGMVAASASGFGIPVMVAKIFPVIFRTEKAPEFIQYYIDAWIPADNQQKVLMIVCCLFLPFIFIVRGIAMLINGYFINIVGMRVLEMLRMDAFDKLQVLPLSFHEKHARGELISRIITDAQNVQMGITQVANEFVKQPFIALSAVSALFFLLLQKGQFGMLMTNFVFVALAIYPIILLGKRIMKKTHGAQSQVGQITALVSENLSSQREVRSYALENQQIGLLKTLSEKYFNLQLKTVKYKQFMAPMIEVVTALALSFILIQGRKAGMAFTDFLAIAAAAFFAFDAIKRLGNAYGRLKQAQASLVRLEEILDEEDTMPDPVHPKVLENARGDIEFRDMSFSYTPELPNAPLALSHVNVKIPQGQSVALVGPSGAGKTTFAHLLLRFYDPTSGCVTFDGIDVKEMTKKNLRENVSFVSQHAVLFRKSIKENIRLGNPASSDEQVEEAAQDAAVWDFAQEQEDGLDTVLGDAGGGLSGGQRQRVAMARAFIKQAPVLVLDEATAALDAESELHIQRSLDKLMKGRTTFIVAHRFSTIRNVDRILVFEHGEIVGDGTHEELYATLPLYKELYDRQK